MLCFHTDRLHNGDDRVRIRGNVHEGYLDYLQLVDDVRATLAVRGQRVAADGEAAQYLLLDFRERVLPVGRLGDVHLNWDGLRVGVGLPTL